MRHIYTAELEGGRRLACVNGLSEGDEHSKFYFATVNAERARDPTTSLILEVGREITDPALILIEVERQSVELYAPAAPLAATGGLH